MAYGQNVPSVTSKRLNIHNGVIKHISWPFSLCSEGSPLVSLSYNIYSSCVSKKSHIRGWGLVSHYFGALEQSWIMLPSYPPLSIWHLGKLSSLLALKWRLSRHADLPYPFFSYLFHFDSIALMFTSIIYLCWSNTFNVLCNHLKKWYSLRQRELYTTRWHHYSPKVSPSLLWQISWSNIGCMWPLIHFK